MSEARWSHRLDAQNWARDSLNPIHDDPIANEYGFRGGLVPGVDVFAYLLHVPAREWGLPYLAEGGLDASFASPVYDGETVTITGAPAGPDGDAAGDPDQVTFTLRDAENDCATGTARRVLDKPPPDPADWPDADPSTVGGPASPETLALGTPMGPIEIGFHADRADEYLREVGEDLTVFTQEGIAHPGWMLRFANYVLAAHVKLGPWIHTSSDVQFLGLVHDGQRVEIRAIVTDEYERKGHRFVVLDVLTTADGVPVQRATHSAIHTLRPPKS